MVCRGLCILLAHTLMKTLVTLMKTLALTLATPTSTRTVSSEEIHQSCCVVKASLLHTAVSEIMLLHHGLYEQTKHKGSDTVALSSLLWISRPRCSLCRSSPATATNWLQTKRDRVGTKGKLPYRVLKTGFHWMAAWQANCACKPGMTELPSTI